MNFIGTYQAVSIGSMPVVGTDDSGNDVFDPDGTRSITLMDRPGTKEDPYGGWKQRGSLHDVRTVIMPDGSEPAADEWPALGYEDEKLFEVRASGSRVVINER